jgi:hypothetical protein
VCQFHSLSKCLSPSDVRTALSSLPRTLDETYERILLNISIEYRFKAVTALQWIIYAIDEKPSLVTIADAIVISPEADPPFNLGDRLPDPLWILEMLPGLITVEGAHDKIGIAHFSVVEYLESSRIMDGPANMFHLDKSKANISILTACICLLKSYEHSTNQILLKQGRRNCLKTPFLPIEQYACINWHRYVESLSNPINPQIARLVLDFALNIKSILHRHHYILPSSRWTNTFIESPGEPLDNSLYAASILNSTNMARILLDAGADVNFQGGYYGSALQGATMGNSPEMVRVLLDARADPNFYGTKAGTPLQVAAWFGSHAMVKALLDAGADVTLKRGLGLWKSTALGLAQEKNFVDVVELLLSAGAEDDANSTAEGSQKIE